MDRVRFIALWQRNLSDQAPCGGETVFADLDARYGESSRHYHNGEHIEQSLAWFDRYRDFARDPDAVELAIWFHDACYGDNPADHETRSAQLFRRLSEGGMAAERQQWVVDLIMNTTHREAPGREDGALLVDVDLGSFARPWHSFLKDSALCRAERRPISEFEFCACQLVFLRTLQDREWIYYSVPFQRHHEADARRNIARLITLLEQRERRLGMGDGE